MRFGRMDRRTVPRICHAQPLADDGSWLCSNRTIYNDIMKDYAGWSCWHCFAMMISFVEVHRNGIRRTHMEDKRFIHLLRVFAVAYSWCWWSPTPLCAMLTMLMVRLVAITRPHPPQTHTHMHMTYTTGIITHAKHTIGIEQIQFTLCQMDLGFWVNDARLSIRNQET